MKATDDKEYLPRRVKAPVRPVSKSDTGERKENLSAVTAHEKTAHVPKEKLSTGSAATNAGDAPAAQQAVPEQPTVVPKEESSSVSAQPDEPGEQAQEGLKDKSIDCVVPEETWKQHAKRRRRSHSRSSTHSGTTKNLTDEDRQEADSGYVFNSHKPRKKGLFGKHHHHHHHHHHHSHHHHHRRHKFKHLATWKKVLIITLCVLLTLITLLTGTFFILRAIGAHNMHTMSDAVVAFPEKDESGNVVDMVDSRGHVITYDGKTYQLNENLVSIAFIGADEGTGDNVHLQMADAVYILTIDTKTGNSTILGVNRDTIADVSVYSQDGQFIDTEKKQLAFSYSYSSDRVTGGRNTAKTLERLFYGLPFDNYFAINMDALVDLNDSIGGVTLTSSLTFVSKEDGRTIHEGEQVTLHGKEADTYVRSRDTSELASNSDRMQRQQQYIRAFINSILPAAKKDLSVIGKMYNVVKANSDTTLDVPKMTYLASVALPKLKTVADMQMISLPGTYKEGEYAEYHVTNEDTLRTMLQVFYLPLK